LPWIDQTVAWVMCIFRRKGSGKLRMCPAGPKQAILVQSNQNCARREQRTSHSWCYESI